MADRPILFSASMIRALLAGRKTVTRRILKASTPRLLCRSCGCTEREFKQGGCRCAAPALEWTPCEAPRHRVGDRLWVRETCQAVEQPSGEDGVHFPADEAWEPIQAGSRGAADDWVKLNHYGRRCGAVVPAIHMPRWASRLTLVVTDVRVERLRDISEEDARAEGVCAFVEATSRPAWGDIDADARAALVRTIYGSHVKAFRHLWESINGEEAWEANPWVAAISFEVHQRNIDFMPAREAA